MTKYLQDLLEAAKKFVLTSEDKEQQRRSFAYVNTVIENSRITREMVTVRLTSSASLANAISQINRRKADSRSTPSLWSVPLDFARGFG